MPNLGLELNKLNTWKAAGYLFLSFGLVFLALDATAGYTGTYVKSYFAAIIPQTTLHLVLTALTPYVTIASFMFVIAVVGLYNAKTSHFVQKTAKKHTKSSSHTKSSQTSVSRISKGYPLPQVSTCPSCKQAIIFVDQYQKWYCLEEEKYM